jgi:hypothetical protein
MEGIFDTLSWNLEENYIKIKSEDSVSFILGS